MRLLGHDHYEAGEHEGSNEGTLSTGFEEAAVPVVWYSVKHQNGVAGTDQCRVTFCCLSLSARFRLVGPIGCAFHPWPMDTCSFSRAAVTPVVARSFAIDLQLRQCLRFWYCFGGSSLLLTRKIVKMR